MTQVSTKKINIFQSATLNCHYHDIQVRLVSEVVVVLFNLLPSVDCHTFSLHNPLLPQTYPHLPREVRTWRPS